MDEREISRLERLAELRRLGALTDDEFDQQKKNVLLRQAAMEAPGEYAATKEPPKTPFKRDGFFFHAALPFERYFEFEGRSGRKEFWAFNILQLMLYLTMYGSLQANYALDFKNYAGNYSLGLLTVAVLMSGVPMWMVFMRRFQDQDRSRWLVLLNFIPLIGGVVALIFMCFEGTRGPNRYGPDPTEA